MNHPPRYILSLDWLYSCTHWGRELFDGFSEYQSRFWEETHSNWVPGGEFIKRVFYKSIAGFRETSMELATSEATSTPRTGGMGEGNHSWTHGCVERIGWMDCRFGERCVIRLKDSAEGELGTPYSTSLSCSWMSFWCLPLAESHWKTRRQKGPLIQSLKSSLLGRGVRRTGV